jgi:hypothetical protein
VVFPLAKDSRLDILGESKHRLESQRFLLWVSFEKSLLMPKTPLHVVGKPLFMGYRLIL